MLTILKNSSEELRSAFTDVLDPRLVALLKNNLIPLQNELEKGRQTQDQHYEAIIRGIQRQNENIEPLHVKLSARQRILDQQYETIITKIREQEVNLTAAIDAVNQHITIMAKALKTEISSRNSMPIDPSWYSNPSEQCIDLTKSLCKQRLAPEENLVKRDSLKEL